MSSTLCTAGEWEGEERGKREDQASDQSGRSCAPLSRPAAARSAFGDRPSTDVLPLLWCPEVSRLFPPLRWCGAAGLLARTLWLPVRQLEFLLKKPAVPVERQHAGSKSDQLQTLPQQRNIFLNRMRSGQMACQPSLSLARARGFDPPLSSTLHEHGTDVAPRSLGTSAHATRSPSVS